MCVIGAVVGEWIGSTRRHRRADHPGDLQLRLAAAVRGDRDERCPCPALFFLVVTLVERWSSAGSPASDAIEPRSLDSEIANRIRDRIRTAMSDRLGANVVAQSRRGRGRRWPRGPGRRPGGRAQRLRGHAARALQPSRRPRLRRHGAGARRHVGQPPAGNLGARHLHGDDRAHGGSWAWPIFRHQHEWGALPDVVRRVDALGHRSTSTASRSRTRSASPRPSTPTAGSASRSRWSQQAGIDLRLHSWFSRTLVEDGQVKGVVCETKNGREAILGDVVIDATGDLDVAASAGAPHIERQLHHDHRVPPRRRRHRRGRALRVRGARRPSQVDRPRSQAPARRRLGLLVAQDAAAGRGVVQLPAHAGLRRAEGRGPDARRGARAATHLTRWSTSCAASMPGFERLLRDRRRAADRRAADAPAGRRVRDDQGRRGAARALRRQRRARPRLLLCRTARCCRSRSTTCWSRAVTTRRPRPAQKMSREIPPCMAMGEAAGVAAALALDARRYRPRRRRRASCSARCARRAPTRATRRAERRHPVRSPRTIEEAA